MVKRGDRVQWIGEDIAYLEKGKIYTVKHVSSWADITRSERSEIIILENPGRDDWSDMPWSMVNFRLLNGLDLAKIAAQKSKRKKNDDQ